MERRCSLVRLAELFNCCRMLCGSGCAMLTGTLSLRGLISAGSVGSLPVGMSLLLQIWLKQLSLLSFLRKGCQVRASKPALAAESFSTKSIGQPTSLLPSIDALYA